MSVSDLELFEAWRRRRDAEAFKALSQRYAGLVYAAALRILGNGHEAEEVAQESFITLATTSRPPKGAIAAWLHRVATNRSLDRVRTARNRHLREQAYAGAQTVEKAPDDWSDILAHVDEAVNALPERYRVPMVLHFYENHSGAAIAASLGITRQAANYRIRHGVDLVRHALRKRGIPVASATFASLLAARLAHAAPLPASLNVSLGQLAIAGVATPTVGIAASVAATLGGLVIMYKALFGGALVLAAIAGSYIAWQHSNLPQATPAPSSYVSRTDATQAAKAEPSQEPAAAQLPAPIGNTGDITGRVYDAVTGVGIAGAAPKLAPADEPKSALALDIRSDETGNYTITGLKPGRYALIAPAGLPAYPMPPEAPRLITVAADSVVRDVDFAMEPGVEVEGVVLSRQGAPVKGAVVYGQISGPGFMRTQATTGEDGTFALCIAMGPGYMDSQAERGDTVSEKQRVALRPEGVKGVTFTLSTKASASITGIVVDTRQQPVARASVGLMCDFAPLGPKRLPIVGTDDAGHFKIPNLLPGDYSVHVAGPDAQLQNESNTQITLKEGETRELRLLLGGYYEISGRVVDTAGNGIERAQIRAILPVETPRDSVVQKAWTQSRADGSFSFIVFENRDYELQVLHEKYRCPDDDKGPVVSAGATNVEIVLQPPGSIRGRVVSATTGKPVTQFSLYMYPRPMEAFGEWVLPVMRLVSRIYDPEGRFEIQYAPAESTLIAMAPGYTSAVETVKVPAAQTVSDLELRLAPSVLIEGWVRDTTGAPVPGARIFCGTVGGYIDASKTAARSDREGHFTLDTVPKETKNLTAIHPLYASGTAPIEDGVTIVLKSGGAIRGLVTANGTPAAETSVLLMYTLPSGKATYHAFAGTDGRYEFSNLPEGDCEVIATHQSGEKMKRSAHVTSGQTINEDFNFELGGSVLLGHINAPGLDVDSIILRLAVSGDQEEFSYETTGNPDSTYKFEGVKAGAARLEVLALPEGRNPVRQIIDLDVPSNGTVEQDIDFGATGVINGAILGAAPDRVGFVTLLNGAVDLSGLDTVDQIQAFLPQAEPLIAAQVKCDATGAYHIEGLPFGAYTLVAVTVSTANEDDISQWRWTTSPVTLDKNATELNLDFDLR